jgi:hypothetical protein
MMMDERDKLRAECERLRARIYTLQLDLERAEAALKHAAHGYGYAAGHLEYAKCCLLECRALSDVQLKSAVKNVSSYKAQARTGADRALVAADMDDTGTCARRLAESPYPMMDPLDPKHRTALQPAGREGEGE